jgi:hypothetical protein
MYGVKESDLTPGSKTFQEIAGDSSLYSISTDVTDDLTDVDYKKNVQLLMIIGKKDSYLGYTACFPWDITETMDTTLFPSDVKDAIIDILKPYGYDEAEIIRFCAEIDEIDAF